MRWTVAEPKKRIASADFEGHSDHIEMSGEGVSAVITYGVKDGAPFYGRQYAFPALRIPPDDTFGTYRVGISRGSDPGCVTEPLRLPLPERFVRVEFDGVLTVFSRGEAGEGEERFEAERQFFPSVLSRAFYERITVRNRGEKALELPFRTSERLETVLGCEGYVLLERTCTVPDHAFSNENGEARLTLLPGEEAVLLFAVSARLADEPPFVPEPDPLAARRARVAELLAEADLTTGDDVIDTAFAFAKLHAGESLFRTGKGLIHCPGGMTYYAAVWCNDECEYAAPWFGFTGDEKEAEAAVTSFRWYEPFMTDEYLPIPSSVIACGRDYWNGAGDRGDAAMYLYGLSRFLLASGRLPDAGQERALRWCAEYLLRKISADRVVVSDSDELEGRISTGINLNTSSLAYGGLGHYAVLLRRMGCDPSRYERAREEIGQGIEAYFGGEVSGYRTYHYHRGCDVVRAWNCLPVYMGITDRAAGTADSIDALLWERGSCRSTEGETILWDRSALYFIASLFRMGDADRGWARLREFSAERLLGEHVPYAVEAYPEGDRRHLSAESALYCRVVTDGLFGVSFDPSGTVFEPHLPSCLPSARLSGISVGGTLRTVGIRRGEGDTVSFL